MTARQKVGRGAPRLGRAALGCGCVALGSCVLLLISLVLGRNVLAAWLVERELAEAGISCTPTLEVDAALDLSRVTVEPSRCALPAESNIDAVSWSSPLTIELDGFSPTGVRAEAVVVELRTPPPSIPGPMPGPLAVLAGARGAILELMKHGARASAHALPDATVADLSFTHAGLPVARLREVRADGVPGQLEAHAGGLALAGVDIGIDTLDAELTPESGVATANLQLDVGIGGFSIQRSVRARLRGAGLDGSQPTLEASLETPL
jgi:hypothetical protein